MFLIAYATIPALTVSADWIRDAEVTSWCYGTRKNPGLGLWRSLDAGTAQPGRVSARCPGGAVNLRGFIKSQNHKQAKPQL